ncbi:hypothetical protein BOTBODRAFT_616081 [Botryobasidium botryosum FD-172 SS1]|uniref:Uncharacterized protein n=1 Tax=Botryobasidium botryosum (strain FD-172 SS1) TaxID=930990 RepID=A0A067LVK2_BOTB1|nr:hypothetical protein BOTBODRAFT_616081 [Botryobasidium botryosum FD-172 SS1]
MCRITLSPHLHQLCGHVITERFGKVCTPTLYGPYPQLKGSRRAHFQVECGRPHCRTSDSHPNPCASCPTTCASPRPPENIMPLVTTQTFCHVCTIGR